MGRIVRIAGDGVAEAEIEERSLDCAARLRFAKEGKRARGSARYESALEVAVRENLESRG